MTIKPSTKKELCTSQQEKKKKGKGKTISILLSKLVDWVRVRVRSCDLLDAKQLKIVNQDDTAFQHVEMYSIHAVVITSYSIHVHKKKKKKLKRNLLEFIKFKLLWIK